MPRRGFLDLSEYSLRDLATIFGSSVPTVRRFLHRFGVTGSDLITHQALMSILQQAKLA
jgi:transposase